MLGVAFHLKSITPLTTEQFDGRFVSREFVCGQQINGIDFFQRALSVSTKQPQAVHLVTKEIQTIRQFAAHREQI